MKKILIALVCIFAVTGCSMSNMDNTPTKKVEDYLNKYQSLDSGVLEDLDATLAADTTLDEKGRKEYHDFMKKHYEDLDYKIKDEKIDGDNATVEAEVTVRNYSDAVAQADTYKSSNEDKFKDKQGAYDATMFGVYRMDELKKVTDTKTYTINFTLTKKDGEWKLNQLSDEDLNKINGLYNG